MLKRGRDSYDTKSYMAVCALRLEAKPEGGATGPSFVGPAAAATDAGEGAVTVPRSGHGVEVGVGAARQAVVEPVAAPFEDVAGHIVNVPGVRGIAAYFAGPVERRTYLGAVIGEFAKEVRLAAAERGAKGSSHGRAGATGVFPLRLGGQ